MSRKDSYVEALKNDGEEARNYYLKSFGVKTEQQKMLEQLLLDSKETYSSVADIACGSGSLSYHLAQVFPESEFTLVDFNEQALAIAAEVLAKNNFKLVHDDIYSLEKLASAQFDLTICWQTLSWLDEPEKALNQLLRITKPGGKIYLSSLFNLEHDVDVYSKVVDHTRSSGSAGQHYNYNTYSKVTVIKWVGSQAAQVKFHPFHPQIDFAYDGRGIGTSTVKDENGLRLQFSAGMLLNWCILEITKSV